MHKKRIVLAFVTGWTLGLAGCALLTHREQITALKSLGGEQRNIEKYVQQQEKFFNKLKSDFQNQRLVKGTSKVKILSLYGEPIYCKGSHESHETCLYRHPTRYFSGERIFLEFDQDQNLSFWEAKSCF